MLSHLKIWKTEAGIIIPCKCEPLSSNMESRFVMVLIITREALEIHMFVLYYPWRTQENFENTQVIYLKVIFTATHNLESFISW